jgi:hypothetical protein
MAEDKKNIFTKKRPVDEAPLHSTESFDEKPKTKSFSLYSIDVERLEGFKNKLKTMSRKKLSDSVMVRVALAYLEEAEQKGGPKFENDLKRLINENK